MMRLVLANRQLKAGIESLKDIFSNLVTGNNDKSEDEDSPASGEKTK